MALEVRLRRLIGGRCVVAVIDTEEGRVLAETTLEGRSTYKGQAWFDTGDFPLDIELEDRA